MRKIILWLWPKQTVDQIIKGLTNIVTQLENHAIKTEAEIADHLTEAVRRKKLADEARAHSTRAMDIASKLGALLR